MWIWQKLDFHNTRPELLKTRTAPLACSRDMPGFCKSSQICCRACLLIKAFHRLLRSLLHSSRLIALRLLPTTRIALTINTLPILLFVTSYNHGTTGYLEIIRYLRACSNPDLQEHIDFTFLPSLARWQPPSCSSPPCLLSYSKCRAP